VACALLAAGDADAEEADILGFEILVTSLAVGVERVAAFEDGVARLEVRQELLDHLVDRLAGLDHDDDGARPLHRLDELHQVGFRHDLLIEPLLFRHRDEVVDLGGGAVVDRDGVAVLGDVERQIGAHYCEPDQADIGRRHHYLHWESLGFHCAAFWHGRRPNAPPSRP